MTPRKTLIPAVLLAALVLMPLGCGSDDDPMTPTPPAPLAVSGTLGAAGGTLTSSDGKMTLTVPAGVLAADTQLAITEMDPADAGTEFDGLDVVHAFRFTPGGLDLGPDSEWTVSTDWPASAAKGEQLLKSPSPLVVITRKDLTRTVPRQLAEMSFTPGVAGATSFSVRGLSGRGAALVKLIETGGTGATVSFGGSWGGPQSAVAGASVNIGEQLWASKDLDMGNFSGTYNADAIAGVIHFLADGDPVAPLAAIDLQDGSSIANYEFDFTLPQVGTVQPGNGFTLSYSMDPAVLEQLGNLLTPIGDLSLKASYRIDPVTVTEDTGSGGDLPTGSFDVSISGGELFIRPITAQWARQGDWLGTGSSGISFYSVNPNAMFTVPSTDLQWVTGAKYGGLFTVSRLYSSGGGKAAGDDQVAVMTYGPSGGTLTEWFPQDDDFGFTQIFASGKNVTDATNLGGDPSNGGFAYVDNTTGVFFVAQYDTLQGSFGSTGPYWSFPGASGNPVSVWARDGGSAVVVTDGTPGHLYLHDRSSIDADATVIAPVGDGPRRVRVLGEIGVVSNYTGGSLKIFTWDASDNVAVTDSVTVAGGPIGIDLVSLAGGQVGVVSTGYGDNTWAVTVIDASGAVVSHTSHDLPAGATAPGHATWVDAEGRQAVISCNGSGNVVVVDSGL